MPLFWCSGAGFRPFYFIAEQFALPLTDLILYNSVSLSPYFKIQANFKGPKL